MYKLTIIFKVIDDKNSLNALDDEGLGVPSGNVASEETLSWTRNGEKGTTSSEDGGLVLAESHRPGSRNSQFMTPSPRDREGSEHDVVNVDHLDACMQKDPAILRIDSGVTEGNLEEKSAVGPICHAGEDQKTDDSVSDKEPSITSGYRLPAAPEDNDNPAGDNTITQLENGSGRSPENRDAKDINVREMLQTLRPASAAATASIQRPKTAGRKMSSSATKHRCSRKEAPGKQKMTDSKQLLQQKTIPKERGSQR